MERTVERMKAGPGTPEERGTSPRKGVKGDQLVEEGHGSARQTVAAHLERKLMKAGASPMNSTMGNRGRVNNKAG